MAYCHSGNKPSDLPIEPHRVYKEWAGYGDWLGTGKVSNRYREFLPFKKARKFAHKLGLKSRREWAVFCRSGQKPNNVPSQPNQVRGRRSIQ